MLELAEVMHLAKANLPSTPGDCLAALTELVANLPTHTVRSEQQIELQQFSTPAPIAYLAALAGRIAATDLVLEPSAGTGLLAAFAHRVGARLVLNQIDPARAEMLAAAFPGVAVTRHDGELIHDVLEPTISPTAVLINPPFSRSIGRHADRQAAFRHLRAALMRLNTGGRCAAILPDRVDTSSRAWAKATEGCTLTLHLELPANAYAKHGTSQAVKIMVLEKGTGTPAGLIRCATLAEALAAIAAKAASPVSAPVPRTASLLARPAGRSSLLGGLASKPRLNAPPAKAARSQTATPIDYTVFAEPLPTGESVGVYLPYRPSRIAIGCASAHPTALVESIAMGSITAPRPTYVPTLPQAVVDAKTLSDAQLETLIYAGDAFERDIPGLFKPVEEGLSIAPSEDGRPYRTGFFLGDGTGAGKGRQVAAIILDQWLRGRRKHIWVSNFANLQKSGLMKTFTDPFRIPCPLPCGNYGRGGRRRQRLPLRLSMRRIRPTGGRASIRSIPLMSALVAEGADVAPYRLVLDGCAASALPVPGLFSQATACAGYAATRSEDLVDPLAHHGRCDRRRWSAHGSPQRRWSACVQRGRRFSTTSRRSG
ncbi:strawberry notch-like NTP hydrolase domain-containing protein [Sphingomonas aurantiaca]|uniref:strawberry notch-like NTP hydrolase domain-containing protein n=1 Tax=Sphingomonas aurantiaca TaxID=185949 RepID=UPI003344D4F3